MKLIIIRGPSGSGKSTIAKALGGIANQNWFEADMYFIRDGRYEFNPRKLGQAHTWCQVRVIEAINGSNRPYDKVIVSNTSMTLSEVNIYAEIANINGIPYEIVRTPGIWNIDDLFSRNTHNVPKVVLAKQIARYQETADEKEWGSMNIFNGANQ